MDNNWKMELIIVLITLLSFALAGCISTPSTKSGKSYIYQIPSIRERLGLSTGESMPEKELSRLERKAHELYEQLYAENPELAEELGKIPDFADNEISDKDLDALVNMTNYYFESESPKIKEAFEEILDVGIRDKRAYCSPLEALKWLAEKRQFREGSESYLEDPLSNYALMRLIFAAWNFREEEKWGDFKRVTNRLNSPELVAKYLQDNIAWKFHKGKTPWLPTRFFRIKRGDCKDYANFATYCLRRAGYYARNVSIRTPRGGHVFCLYTENNKFFAIDNMNLRGPFYSSEKAIQAITSLH